MSSNVGIIDRVIRALLGLALIAAALLGVFPNMALLFWAAIVVGLVLIVTALAGFCPLYRLLGLSTCPVSRQ